MKTNSYIASFLSAFIDFLYPPFCFICKKDTFGEENKFVCKSCLDQIEEIEPPFCTKCGKSFPSKEAFLNIEKPVCGRCEKKSENIYYSRTIGLGKYDSVLKELIHLYKYNKKKELEKVLTALLMRKIKADSKTLQADLIVPVPLHWIKKRKRGFNQSEELGRYISKKLKIPMANYLKRRKNTKPQIGLSGEERRRNVKNAFGVRWLSRRLGIFYNYSFYSIKDKSIVLIDDVVTTGATVNECSKVLKRAGAKEVKVICLAIAGE